MLRQTPTNLADIQSISTLQIALDAWALSPADVIEMCLSRGLEFRAHPLGFISCVFFVEGDRKARLHIWPISEKLNQGEGVTIHDHVFNFTSWVLAGEIINRCVFIDGTGTPCSVYEASYTGDSSVLVRKNETLNITNGEIKKYSTGMRYSMRAGQLHETRSTDSDVAVTVLITHDVSANHPLVIGPLSGHDKHEYYRRIISRDELNEVINSL
ncbi:hypothetical protein HYE76_27665 [Pseudomonas tolaasii]|uniref:hypothetical protein n=1 Tax=Pseudomonas tolaasii TaxID=29442 RepID=UPI0015A11767|nr:hypothetical protein [Pseudomonas tolaasii]NWC30211.1 hypothetical protein [Pseudomonas tolaasii]